MTPPQPHKAALAALLISALTASAVQAEPRPYAPRFPVAGDPKRPVVAANAAARVQPASDTFQGAVQRYAWSEGGLYQVYAAPGRVTDLVLQPGEQLIGPGPVAAGDTSRWILGDTESGTGDTRRVHVLVKPTAANLATNLVINTDRRTYYVELKADPAVYMASVAWTYPQDALIAVRARVLALAPPAPAPTPAADPPALNFDYKISGDRPAWRPTQVFDNGAKVIIVFPAQIAQTDLPPLFVLDPAGKPELVAYRVVGRQMVVDRLFRRAELRLGDKRKQRRVTITRTGAVGQ